MARKSANSTVWSSYVSIFNSNLGGFADETEYRVPGFRFWASNFGFRVPDFGFPVPNSGSRGSGFGGLSFGDLEIRGAAQIWGRH